MKLHLFNPSHDMALASGVSNYVAPHVVRQLESDLAFLPALWAEKDDAVLVDDVALALSSFKKLKSKLSQLNGGAAVPDVLFVTKSDIADAALADMITEISPWGWNSALRDDLLHCQSSLEKIIPTDNHIEVFRQMSSRVFASNFVLRKIVETDERLVGESRVFIGGMDDLLRVVGKGKWVLKAPWSSSGRGVRYVCDADKADGHLLGWCENVLRRQGAIMIEPYYDKVLDFAIEFCSCADGSIRYGGLSLFKTKNGAYLGNVLASEDSKSATLARYIDTRLLDTVREKLMEILAPHFSNIYIGPFGVDMMVVRDGGNMLKLHPCVEINLRNTMGNVALELTPMAGCPEGSMRIELTDRFHFRIENDHVPQI